MQPFEVRWGIELKIGGGGVVDGDVGASQADGAGHDVLVDLGGDIHDAAVGIEEGFLLPLLVAGDVDVGGHDGVHGDSHQGQAPENHHEAEEGQSGAGLHTV